MFQSTIEDILHCCRNTSHMSQLHTYICQMGLEAYPSIGNQLISSFAEAGNMGFAQQVLEKLQYYDARTWEALIVAYVRSGECERARNVYARMQEDNFLHPSAHAFVALLKACAMLQDVEWACVLYMETIENGLLERHNFVGSALVHMFAKCGVLEKAQAIFDKLLVKDVVLWNALIDGYADQGHGKDAIQCFAQMQHVGGVALNPVTLVSSLTACGSISNGDKGQELHMEALKRGFETELAIGNSLVHMYSKCGWLATARKVFDNLSVRDVVSWNVLITGYVELSYSEDALLSFELMQKEGVSSDDVTFLCSLKACASVGNIEKAWKMHSTVVRFGLERQLLIGTSIVDMYAKCGSLATAEKVFCAFASQNVASWNALLTAYADHGCIDEVFFCFERMLQNGVSPNSVTFICVLKCCGCIASKGLDVYVAVAKRGLEKELLIGSTVVDMCCKGGLLLDARSTFDKFPFRTVISWNSLITGYAKHGRSEEAFYCLEHMQNEGISPSAATFVCVLKACYSIQATNKHQEMHAEIVKKGLEGETVMGNVLVDVYMKRGLLAESQQIFEKLSVQDVISWSSFLGGLAEQGCNEEVLDYLKELQQQCIWLNSALYVCILKACSSIGATSKGQELHVDVVKQGLERDSLVGNMLVDMYANGGSLLEAQNLFETLPSREIVSLNALIAGYAQLGESVKAIDVLDKMLGEGLNPNEVTFLSVLNACSHSGLVDKGLLCFETIFSDYGLLPTLKHYTCVVDVLGRSGFLDKAAALIEVFPFHPDMAVWLIMLGACHKWADVNVGRQAFQHAVQLNEQDTAPYAYMSNIYRSEKHAQEVSLGCVVIHDCEFFDTMSS